MARTGISFEDVRNARDAVQLAGDHPSVDAIRAQLGNTGSKSTIVRHLKALEAEEEQGLRPTAAISGALQNLVAQLAERLHQEAAELVAEAKEHFEEQLRQRDGVVTQLRQENGQHSLQIQRLQTDLQGERLAHSETRESLSAATAEAARRAQQVEELQQRITDHSKHAQSLEDKHIQAREALEHFRQASKEQREQEQRRNEHQVQQLQMELRTLNQTLIVKQHELTTAHHEQGQLTGELSALRTQCHVLQEQLAKEREASSQLNVQQATTIATTEERHRQSQLESERISGQLEQLIEQLNQRDVTIAQLRAKLDLAEIRLGSSKP